MLQCVAVCYSVLQCVTVCCSVLQCVAVCCSVLHCVETAFVEAILSEPRIVLVRGLHQKSQEGNDLAALLC